MIDPRQKRSQMPEPLCDPVGVFITEHVLEPSETPTQNVVYTVNNPSNGDLDMGEETSRQESVTAIPGLGKDINVFDEDNEESGVPLIASVEQFTDQSDINQKNHHDNLHCLPTTTRKDCGKSSKQYNMKKYLNPTNLIREGKRSINSWSKANRHKNESLVHSSNSKPKIWERKKKASDTFWDLITTVINDDEETSETGNYGNERNHKSSANYTTDNYAKEDNDATKDRDSKIASSLKRDKTQFNDSVLSSFEQFAYKPYEKSPNNLRLLLSGCSSKQNSAGTLETQSTSMSSIDVDDIPALDASDAYEIPAAVGTIGKKRKMRVVRFNECDEVFQFDSADFPEQKEMCRKLQKKSAREHASAKTPCHLIDNTRLHQEYGEKIEEICEKLNVIGFAEKEVDTKREEEKNEGKGPASTPDQRSLNASDKTEDREFGKRGYVNSVIQRQPSQIVMPNERITDDRVVDNKEKKATVACVPADKVKTKMNRKNSYESDESVPAQKKTRKNRKRKDHSDGKPTQPLTAYNLFFKDERNRILASMTSKPLQGNKDSISGVSPDNDGKLLGLRSSKEQEKIGSKETDKPTKRKRGRPRGPNYYKQKTPHGKISFQKLAQLIGSRWKQRTPEIAAEYNRRAILDRERYYAEMLVYNRKKVENKDFFPLDEKSK